MRQEELFIRQVSRSLDLGTRELDPAVSERLRAGRERALAHRLIATAEVSVSGGGGAVMQLGGDEKRHPVRTFLAILALLLGVLISYYWNAFEQASENEEVDSALLAEELPPKAYLDKGFQAWLEKHSSAGD
jgi:hypothetical protein